MDEGESISRKLARSTTSIKVSKGNLMVQYRDATMIVAYLFQRVSHNLVKPYAAGCERAYHFSCLGLLFQSHRETRSSPCFSASLESQMVAQCTFTLFDSHAFVSL